MRGWGGRNHQAKVFCFKMSFFNFFVHICILHLILYISFLIVWISWYIYHTHRYTCRQMHMIIYPKELKNIKMIFSTTFKAFNLWNYYHLKTDNNVPFFVFYSFIFLSCRQVLQTLLPGKKEHLSSYRME